MNNFAEIAAENIELKPFSLINNSWMLITAGCDAGFNTMTASWGGLGTLWNKSVAICVIRPTRYTFEFVESNDLFTLCFFDEQYRDALNLCGTKSGRDIDKVAQTGLTPIFEDGTTYFAQASMVFFCRKLYAQNITPDCFVEKALDSLYAKKDYHKMYVGEIVKVLVKK